MKTRLILSICSLVCLVTFVSGFASAAEEVFYWYRDFDGNNKPDQRITLAGDFERDVVPRLTFAKAVECTTYFNHAWFVTLNCFNTPACPVGETCKADYPRITSITWASPNQPCHCVHEKEEASDQYSAAPGRTYVYVRTGDDSFQALSMSGEEFADYLVSNYRVIEIVSLSAPDANGKDGQVCDQGATWTIDWNCKALECPVGHTCVKNTSCVVVGITTLTPLCVCHDAQIPSLTTWGIVALVILLIGSAGFLMLRKRAATAV